MDKNLKMIKFWKTVILADMTYIKPLFPNQTKNKTPESSSQSQFMDVPGRSILFTHFFRSICFVFYHCPWVRLDRGRTGWVSLRYWTKVGQPRYTFSPHYKGQKVQILFRLQT